MTVLELSLKNLLKMDKNNALYPKELKLFWCNRH